MIYQLYCSEILDLFVAAGCAVPTQDSDVGTAVQILQTICNSQSHTVSNASEIFDALDEIENNLSSDFTLEFDGNEYRIIANNVIWEIYKEEIQRIVEDCYDLKLDNIPDFIAFEIDWEQTAKNCYVDGYGHTFSGYDGSEEEIAGYWIFRTN